MRWTEVALAVLIALNPVTVSGLVGCAGLIPQIQQEDPLNRNHPDTVCVARYVQLTPDLLVGYDGCGNVWTKDTSTDKCQIISADGQRMIDISCPAQGDTLSWIPGGTR